MISNGTASSKGEAFRRRHRLRHFVNLERKTKQKNKDTKHSCRAEFSRVPSLRRPRPLSSLRWEICLQWNMVILQLYYWTNWTGNNSLSGMCHSFITSLTGNKLAGHLYAFSEKREDFCPNWPFKIPLRNRDLMIANPEDLSWQWKVTEAVLIFLRLVYVRYQLFRSQPSPAAWLCSLWRKYQGFCDLDNFRVTNDV